MEETTLQDRLREHAKAFDGLLSLIPAKLYYGNGDEPSEQWKRKKQSKAEKLAARRANVDPDNVLNKSVKEILDERAARHKRKRGGREVAEEKEKDEDDEKDESDGEDRATKNSDGDSDEDDNDNDGIVKETPGQDLKSTPAKKNLKEDKVEEEEEKEDDDNVEMAAEKNEVATDSDEVETLSLEAAKLTKRQAEKLLRKQQKSEKRAEKRRKNAEEKGGKKASVKGEEEEEKERNGKKEKKGKTEKTEKTEKKEKKDKKAKTDIPSQDEPLQSTLGFSALMDVDSTDNKTDKDDGSISSSADASDAKAALFDNVDGSASVSNTTPASSAMAPSPDIELEAATGEEKASDKSTTTKSHIKIPTDTAALRARLAAKIEALRAARKAITTVPSGSAAAKAAEAAAAVAAATATKEVGEESSHSHSNSGALLRIRTRQQLIESRRQKQAERKAHKKELRKAARAEEERKREEAVASARGSPLVTQGSSPRGAHGGGGEDIPTNFSFGRVAFADGTRLSHDLTTAKEAKVKATASGATAMTTATTGPRGPAASDVKAQLARLEAQKKRLAGMDEEKRRSVEEKERWLAARRRADTGQAHHKHLALSAAAAGALADGGRTETLLKKAIKRKEKAKKRSERDWAERKEGVVKAQHGRQRKREDNLRKRREDKMLHRSGLAKKAKKKPAGAKGKGGGRPGFEGAFGRK